MHDPRPFLPSQLSSLARRLAAATLCLSFACTAPVSTLAATTHKKKAAATKSAKSAKTTKTKKGVRARKTSRHSKHPNHAARNAQLKQAFVASSELRPMAQQLAAGRSHAAYAGVTAYAESHTGDASAAAWLALGHAYLIDKKYADATSSLSHADAAGDALDDYAAYLRAKASLGAGNYAATVAALKDFADQYPESTLNAEVPELLAQAYLGLNDAANASQALADAPDESQNRAAFMLADAEAKQALGNIPEANTIYKQLLLAHPLSNEAQIARGKVPVTLLSTAEVRSLADAYYNGGHYADAADQYRTLRDRATDVSARNSYAVAAAACELKLKHLSMSEAEALADTNDESGARRLYLMAELARSSDAISQQQDYLSQLRTRFATSPWFAEALFSSGNMYLLRKDYAHAVSSYAELAERFPQNENAATAHWRAGWWSYRQGQYAEAARIFDAQLRLFPNAKETASALYWRGRVYEANQHEPEKAAACYRAVVRGYQHYFYAEMSRERLAAMGPRLSETSVTLPGLERYQPPVVPHLDASVPEDDPHIIKARLLANAGLTEYIPQEIGAVPGSSAWSAIAEAKIYASFGENYRAMRVLKKAIPYAASAPIKSIPLAYWRILFPEPYWDTIRAESAKNGLDPYLVASLIRQESEFNPTTISHANAYGLMQLLPSVGRQLARQEGMGNIEAGDLLDPVINIRLGTRYFKQLMDRFNNQPEYALAAYNAGESRVVDWQAAGPYTGIDEYVESIPFTETREYVEAILRNRETYKAIDDYTTHQATAPIKTASPQL